MEMNANLARCYYFHRIRRLFLTNAQKTCSEVTLQAHSFTAMTSCQADQNVSAPERVLKTFARILFFALFRYAGRVYFDAFFLFINLELKFE